MNWASFYPTLYTSHASVCTEPPKCENILTEFYFGFSVRKRKRQKGKESKNLKETRTRGPLLPSPVPGGGTIAP